CRHDRSGVRPRAVVDLRRPLLPYFCHRLNVIMGPPRIMRSLFVCLFALTLAAPAAAQNPKLTTVLADLVRAQSAAGAQTALTAPAMPRRAQDRIAGRRLPFDANNQVQVYILVSAVTDDTVQQLTAAGATIEIRDEARRRVQAHLPVSRLDAVAQLGVVDAI